MKPIYLILPFCGLLAACETPTPPTIALRDVDRAFAEADRIGALQITPRDQVPLGTVTYDGQVGADITGDLDGSILGDMTMTVAFDRNRIDGTVDNINLIDPDGFPSQRLDGRLDIAGVETAGDLDAGASGRLAAVDGNGEILRTDVNLDLEGAVYNDRINGDAVFGTARGTGEGDIDIDINGVFFGTER